MSFSITQNLQDKTIEGTLSVDAPLNERGGELDGVIDGEGNIVRFFVTSLTSPSLDFTVTGHQNNTYRGTYYGRVYITNDVEQGTWQASLK